MRCATCDRDQPTHRLGRYPDGRDYCLRRDGHGGLCYRERHPPPPGPAARPIAALPAGSGAFVEMAP